MSSAWNSSNPPVSPSKRRHCHDTHEPSPNNRATCKKCSTKITKGEMRVGIQCKMMTPNGREFWGPRYYHEGCISEKTKRSLFLDPATSSSTPSKNSSPPRAIAETSPKKPSSVRKKPATKCVKSEPKAVKQEKKVLKLKAKDRRQLEMDLRQLRRCYAEIQGCEDEEWRIYQNKSLNDIVEKLPSNTAELMQCWGIKHKRCYQYGDSILRVVRKYLAPRADPTKEEVKKKKAKSNRKTLNQQTRQRQGQASVGLLSNTSQGTTTDALSARNSAPAVNRVSPGETNAPSDASDDEIETGPSLTIEEIVRRRVEEAQARGEVFEIL